MNLGVVLRFLVLALLLSSCSQVPHGLGNDSSADASASESAESIEEASVDPLAGFEENEEMIMVYSGVGES